MFNRLQSGFLFADPSFVSGAGRLMDWYGLYDSYNESRSGREADAEAIFADWRVVGEEIVSATLEFHVESPSL